MGHKNLNTLKLSVWTKKQTSSSRNSAKSGVKIKKKGLVSKLYLWIFSNSGVKPQIKGLYNEICEKQFLLTNSGVITRFSGVSGIELHSSGTNKPVTFFGAQSSLGYHNSRLGGAQAVIFWKGTAPECLRGLGPAASSQQFIEL